MIFITRCAGYEIEEMMRWWNDEMMRGWDDEMAPKIKLVYFNIRGRGEIIRLTLHAGGIPFVDERVEYRDWPQRRDSECHEVLVKQKVPSQVHVHCSISFIIRFRCWFINSLKKYVVTVLGFEPGPIRPRRMLAINWAAQHSQIYPFW